jgi:chromosome partitioning protein
MRYRIIALVQFRTDALMRNRILMTRSGCKIVVRIKKGGGSKTTAAINLATSLHQKGKDKDLNVLLVDLDPQANATLAVGIDPRTLKKNINHLLIDLSVNPKEVIVQTSYGLDLLPSHPDLSNTESGMQATQLGVVRSLLEPIEELYDFIILDTPPAKSYLSVSAVVAADEVLLPLQVHYLALQGLGETLDEIDKIRKGLNPTIKVAGVLPVMYNKYTNIGKAILEELKDKYANLVYPFEVDFSVKHIEASVAGLPIVLYDRAHQGAIAYNKLADTFL